MSLNEMLTQPGLDDQLRIAKRVLLNRYDATKRAGITCTVNCNDTKENATNIIQTALEQCWGHIISLPDYVLIAEPYVAKITEKTNGDANTSREIRFKYQLYEKN